MKDEITVFGIRELFGDSAVELFDQGIEICIDIQQADWLRMKPELSPGHDFAEFFKGPESSGQGDEPIGDLRHRGLSFVHGTDNSQLRDIGSARFTREQRLGDYPDNLSATFLDGLRNASHQPYTATSVDQPDVPSQQCASHGMRGFSV